jgi:acetyl-CoA C-acetyltransferase
MSQATYILGGHQTDFARAWAREGLDFSDMMREAALGALEDAQLDASAIEAIHVGNAMGELYRGQGHMGAVVAQVVPELYGVPASRHEAACASSSMAILAAMAEIEAGRYDCVLVLGVEEEKNIPGDEASIVQNSASWQGKEGLDCRFMWPAVFGRISAAYEDRYGLDRAHLRRISEINFANAKRNPKAQTRGWRMTEASFAEDNATNPMIEPGVRRSDCSQITDGACAIILASPNFAAAHAARRGEAGHGVPAILGWGHKTAGIRFLDKLERSRSDPYLMPHVRQTALDARRRAGVQGIGGVDGVETHDCFTSTEYLAIDHLGVTDPGKSWQAIEDGWIEPSGRIPFNASGGLMGVGHPVGATGARMMLDAARQVAGAAGDCQIEEAKTMQTLNIGGSFGTVASFVVGVRT